MDVFHQRSVFSRTHIIDILSKTRFLNKPKNDYEVARKSVFSRIYHRGGHFQRQIVVDAELQMVLNNLGCSSHVFDLSSDKSLLDLDNVRVEMNVQSTNSSSTQYLLITPFRLDFDRSIALTIGCE